MSLSDKWKCDCNCCVRRKMYLKEAVKELFNKERFNCLAEAHKPLIKEIFGEELV